MILVEVCNAAKMWCPLDDSDTDVLVSASRSSEAAGKNGVCDREVHESREEEGSLNEFEFKGSYKALFAEDNATNDHLIPIN